MPKSIPPLLLSCLLLSACSTSKIETDIFEKPNGEETVPSSFLSGTFDRDGDGLADRDDPCPMDPLNDIDGDGICAELLADLDSSGCVDDDDTLAFEEQMNSQDLRSDLTGDGVVDLSDIGAMSHYLSIAGCRDNCPSIFNPDQEDFDENGLGDICEGEGSSFCQPFSVEESEPVFHVAKTGIDGSTCGNETSPCRTIQYAIQNQIETGGTVLVHSGTYTENRLYLRSGTTLKAADGPLTAKIYGQDETVIRISNVSNIVVDGFEIYSDWNTGGERDGLIRVLGGYGTDGQPARNIIIRNTMAHDAPYDADVIKVSGQVHNLLMENLILFNPGQRTNGMYQENIDIFARYPEKGLPLMTNIILRNSWLFHTEDVGGDWLIYAKAQSYETYSQPLIRGLIYENNIFGPSVGGGWQNPAVGVGTNDISHIGGYVIEDALVRNNVFLGLGSAQDAALAIDNSLNVWVHNNVFYENAARNLIEFYSGTDMGVSSGTGRGSDDIYLLNNIFLNNDIPNFYRWRTNFTSDGLTNFVHDYNHYVGNSFSPGSEDHSIFDGNPRLLAPAVPSINPLPTAISDIGRHLSNFLIASSSPGVDLGVSPLGFSGGDFPTFSVHAQAQCDVEGELRPGTDDFDLGIDELP